MSTLKKIIASVLLMIAVLSLTACKNSSTANEFIDLSTTVISTDNVKKTTEVTVFYTDKSGYVIPVQMSIPWSEGIAKSVIRKMMYTPELQRELVVMGLESLMPPEAVINGLDISKGLAKIDFKTAKLTFNSKKAEQNFVTGVVLALTSFPTVKEVQFMFNGHILQALPNGTDVSKPLKAQDINAVTGSVGSKGVLLYYHASSTTNYEYFVPVTVYLSQDDCVSAVNYMIDHEFENLQTCIPHNSKLLATQVIDNTLCLFFNDEFNKLRDSYTDEKNAIRSITLTCSQFFNTSRVKIYAGNKEYVPFDGIDTTTFANVF